MMIARTNERPAKIVSARKIRYIEDNLACK